MTPAEHRAAAEGLLAAAAKRTSAAAGTAELLHTQAILRDRVLTEHDLSAALVHALLAHLPHDEGTPTP